MLLSILLGVYCLGLLTTLLYVVSNFEKLLAEIKLRAKEWKVVDPTVTNRSLISFVAAIFCLFWFLYPLISLVGWLGEKWFQNKNGNL